MVCVGGAEAEVKCSTANLSILPAGQHYVIDFYEVVGIDLIGL